MKKTYIYPTIKIVNINMNGAMLHMSVGDDMNSGEGDAREAGLVWELEEVSEEN